MRTPQLLIGLCLLIGLHQPAQAALQRSSDFSQGHSIGVGLYGLSYDYGIGGFSAGLAVSSGFNYSFAPNLNEPLKPSLRLLGRFFEADGLSAAIQGGLQYDPGYVGGRSYLIPDLGVSVSYDLRQFDWPFALRMNLSLAVREDRAAVPLSGPDASAPTGNLFQRLGFGPNTSLEIAWLANEHLEITAGGGTLLGTRMKF